MEKPPVPDMDICICLAASYSAMSLPLSLLSKENNPLEMFLFWFFVCLFVFGEGRWFVGTQVFSTKAQV